MKLYDFDKSLNNFAQNWYDTHADGMTPDEMENAVESIYEEWADTAIGELGASPRGYFSALGSDGLVSAFLAYYEEKAIPSVLMDELSARKDASVALIDLVRESEDGELVETCMQLLEEMGSTEVFPLYVDWILEESTDDDIALHAAEIVQEHVNLVADRLVAAIPSAGDKIRDRISDLLVYAKPCEEGYRLLVERLLKGKDLPLYATYLGMYGDERAIAPLKQMAVDCDYIAFMEIRNAVERLGGEMDIERDFSNDPMFLRIKKGVGHGSGKVGNGQKEQ